MLPTTRSFCAGLFVLLCALAFAAPCSAQHSIAATAVVQESFSASSPDVAVRSEGNALRLQVRAANVSASVLEHAYICEDGAASAPGTLGQPAHRQAALDGASDFAVSGTGCLRANRAVIAEKSGVTLTQVLAIDA